MAAPAAAGSSTVSRELFLHVKASSPSSLPATSNVLTARATSPPGLTYRIIQSRSIPGRRRSVQQVKASPEVNNTVSSADDEDGISLGTMKLPLDIDIPRFESLLFQWANSLCQGANIPLPVPLKVDKIGGGIRLGFVEIDDGKTDVPVYIDCLVFPATESSGPYFRAVRNGLMKDKAPAGEPRIMKSLLAALQKSVDIARV